MNDINKETEKLPLNQGENDFNGENSDSDIWDRKGDLADHLDKQEAKKRKIEQEKHNASICSAEHIDALLEAGARIFPVRQDKTPAVPKGRSWKNYSFSRENLIKHRGPLGLLPGSLGLSVIDIDSPEYEDSLKERIEGIGSSFCSQTTFSGGTHVAFKTSQPVRNAKWQHKAIRGDFRGGEGYVVMWEPWKWADAVDGLDALPDCNAGFQAFFDEFLVSAVDADGKFRWNEDSIKEVLELLDPKVGRDDWLRYCRAIADAAVEAGLNEQEVFALVKGWSEKADNWSGDADLDAVLRPCNGYEGPHAAAGPLLAYAKNHGWEIPRGHGGPREKAGRRRINPDVDDPLTLLAETCVNSENFCRMEGGFGHWQEEREKWELVSKPPVLAVIAVRDYLETAGLNPAQGITTGVGTILEAQLILFLQGELQKIPNFGMWPEKSGMIFDQFTGKRRKITKEDYILNWLDYDINESIEECPKLLWDIVLSAVRKDEEMAHFILLVLSQICFETNKKQMIFHFFGKAGSGKGLLARFLKTLLGKHGCTTIDMGEVNNRVSQALAGIPGKRLVTMEEQNKIPIYLLKLLSGEDEMTGKKLFLDEFKFEYDGNILLSSQHQLPKSDEGLYRRLVPIPFVKAPDNPDPDLKYKLKDARPEIMGFLWNHWKNVVRNMGQWEFPEKVRIARDAQNQQTGTLEEWVKENIEISETSTLEVTQIKNKAIEELDQYDSKQNSYVARRIREIAEEIGFGKKNVKELYAAWVNPPVEIESEEVSAIEESGTEAIIQEANNNSDEVW